MCLKNCSKFLDSVYNYLGYYDYKPDENTKNLIDEAIDEVIKLAQFKYQYIELSTLPSFLNHESYLKHLEGSTSFIVGFMTLGSVIDNRTRYYSKANLVKMCIFDSVSSAYLEYLSDDFETRFGDNRTFRFCPGYGGTDISDIRGLYNLVKPNKSLGIEILETNLMVPLKSMCGIIGLGKKTTKSCDKCLLHGKCRFNKEGRTCYSLEKE